jgi:hypothetical protein
MVVEKTTGVSNRVVLKIKTSSCLKQKTAQNFNSLGNSSLKQK